MDKTRSMNWPVWWKILILINISLFNMLGNMFAAGVSPLIILFVEDLHMTVTRASQLSSWALLSLGISNLWSRPTAAYIGKRYTILISQVLFIVCNIWGATAKTSQSLLASRIVGGLGGGVVETLGPEIIAQLFPEHQLARAMVVYTICLAAGGGVGPLIAGFISTGTGTWRWFIWVIVIAASVNFICMVFMMPEPTPLVPAIEEQFYTQEIASTIEESGKAEEFRPATVEAVEDASLNDQDSGKSYFEVWRERSLYWNLDDINPTQNWFILLIQPLRMLLVPAPLATVLIFGVTVAWNVVLSIVVSTVYSMPPYLWHTSSIGLLALGPISGLIIGMPFGGPLADHLYKKMMRRNPKKPAFEIRLLPVFIAAIISPGGVLISGLSIQHHWHWIWTAVGSSMLTFGLSAGANPLLTYAVDAHPGFIAETATLISTVRNCLGAGLSFITVQWYLKEGAAKEFGIMAGILWALYLLVIPLYIYGAHMKEWHVPFTSKSKTG
ncbi:putative MFS transporter [Hyaloscypha variabilis]